MAKINHKINIFFEKTDFIGSFHSVENIPFFNNMFECCFVGRSNVGKSSLINSITKNKKNAKTSKTPGRTQKINIFKIQNNINLVDLPGYGFSKVSKILQNQMSELISAYIESRVNLKHVFVLIDIKVGIKNSDIDMFDSLSNFDRNFTIIFTKIDKTSKKTLDEQRTSVKSLMKNYPKKFSNIFFTSAKSNYGIIDIQKEIYRLSQI